MCYWRLGEGEGAVEAEGAGGARVLESGAEVAAGVGEGDFHVVFRGASMLRVGARCCVYIVAEARLEDAPSLVQSEFLPRRLLVSPARSSTPSSFPFSPITDR